MKKSLLLFSLFIGMAFSLQNRVFIENTQGLSMESSPTGRIQNCFYAFKLFLNPSKIKEKASNLRSSFFLFLKKYHLKFRYNIVLFFADQNKVSDNYSYKLASFLNGVIKEGVLPREEVDQIIKKLHAKGLKKLFWGEDGKVYSESSHMMATSEDLLRVREILRNKEFSIEDYRYLLTEFEELTLSKKEVEKVAVLLEGGREIRDIESIYYYIRYLRGQKPENYLEALDDMEFLFAQDAKSKYLAEFRKYQRNTDRAQRAFSKKEKKRISRNNPGWIESDIDRELDKNLKLYGRSYNKLYFNCKARTQNIDRMATNKKLLRSMLAFEAVSGVGAFSFTHWNDEKDQTYWRKLAFDMAVSLPWAVVRSKVASAPKVSMKVGILTDYILGSFMDIFPTLVVFQQQFGVKDRDIEEKLAQIVRSQEFQKYLEKLISIMESDEVEEGKIKVLKGLGIKDMESFVNNDELEKSEAEHLLRETIAREIYLSRRGDWPWIETGTIGMDTFIYNKAWGTQSSTRNIAVAFWMYHILCTGQLSPKKAFMWTFALYAANKAFNSLGYQYLRKGFIGH